MFRSESGEQEPPVAAAPIPSTRGETTMNTPATIAGGFFAQLMPMLADRTVMMIVSKADEQHLTVSVIPKRMKDSENAALATPLCCTGTPEELDRELPTQVREFVAGHVALGVNLAEIQREREDAEKAARDELKKKQKTIGNGGARNTASEPKPKEADKPTPTPPPSPMLSLFDSPAQEEAAVQHPTSTGGGEEVNHAGQSDAS
jgi:PRTRC genetic system protein E